MGSFGNFLGGLIVGAAVGVGAVIFTTPRSGEETRAELTSFWNNALDTGKQVARQREDELWAEFNARVAEPAGIGAVAPAPQLTSQERPQLTSQERPQLSTEA